MNVYVLKPKGKYNHGMALVAAPTFAHAKQEYILKGSYGEMYYFGEFDFNEKYSTPIAGLEWHGEQGVICESIYIE